MAELKIHPAAETFGLMDRCRFEELKADIKANGVRVPLAIYDGMLLDGRNRYTACLELGITDFPRENVTGNPWDLVWSLNGNRRDIAQDVRAQCWLFCNENSEAWKRERERIQQDANEKRSKAAKGNDNAAKERKNSAGTKIGRAHV